MESISPTISDEKRQSVETGKDDHIHRTESGIEADNGGACFHSAGDGAEELTRYDSHLQRSSSTPTELPTRASSSLATVA